MLPIFCPLPSVRCMCKQMRAYVRICVCVLYLRMRVFVRICVHVVIFGSDGDSKVIGVMLEMPTISPNHMHTNAHAHSHAHATANTQSLTLMQRSQENVGVSARAASDMR